MSYTPSFTPQYPEWHDLPTENTPIVAAVFTKYDNAIENIEDFLDGSTAVKPTSKTQAMTQEVGVDNLGRLYTAPSGGGGGGTASSVSYNNTSSGLVATNVQGAIDELAQSGGGTAASISYNNTQSGLTADDVQEAIDEIASDFQDGCDIIVDAVTAKGQIPASNSPQDIATAIGNITTSGIPLLSRAAWNALTTEQKQAYEYVAIQDTNVGFTRGELVYGIDFTPPYLELIGYTTETPHTFTVSEAGIYLIMVATSYQGVGSITLPQGTTVLSTIDEEVSDRRMIHARIARLYANDTIITTSNVGNWTGRIVSVIKLSEITTIQEVDVVSTADDTTTYTLPNDNNKYLVYGLAVSRTDGVSRDDTTNTSGELDMITGDWGYNSISRVDVCRGNASPNYSFYGYDGGFSAVISWQIS